MKFNVESRKLFAPISRWNQILYIIGAISIYIFLFITLHDHMGPAVSALVVLPVAIAGWFFGLKIGIISALLSIPFNTLLIALVEYADLDGFFHKGGPGMITVVIIGGIVGLISDLTKRLSTELTERKLAEKASRQLENVIRLIVNGTAGVTGETFFCELVRYLSVATEVHIAFVAELISIQPKRSRTLGIWVGKNIVDNFEWELAGTPCEHVVNKKTIYLSDNVQTKFPDDKWLSKVRAKSYLGIPLIDSSDKVIGHMGLLDKKQIINRERIEDILSVFAARAGAELERVQAEEALRKSEERMRHIITSTPIIHYTCRQEGEHWPPTFYSPNLKKLLGYDVNAVIGDSDWWWINIHPNDRDQVITGIRSAMEGGKDNYMHEYYFRNAHGKYFFIHDELSIIRNAKGHPIEIVGSWLDITERKRVEDALNESEKKFRTLSESVQAIPYQYNIKLDQFTYIGKQVENILGYSVASWTDFDSWSNRIHSDDREAAVNYCISKYREGKDHSFEYRSVTPRGETVWIHDVVTVRKDENGSPAELVGYMLDITERKRGDEEIHLLLTMIQSINDAEDFKSALEITLRKVCEVTKWDYGEAWIPRSDGTTLEYCPVGYCKTESLEEFRKLSEEVTFSPGTGLPGRVWSSKQPEWIQDVSKGSKKLFKRSKNAHEAGLKAALGVPIMINNEVLAVLNFFMTKHRYEEKHLVELISTVATQLGSVIQRKQSEDALTKSEEKFRGVVNQSNDGIYVLQGDRFVFINSIFTEITGYHLDELRVPGFNYMQLVADEGKKVLEERESLRQRGKKPPSHFIFKGLRKDGSEIDLDVSVTAIEWEGAQAVLGSVRDVTIRIESRKKLEEALQSAKQANSVKSLFLANMSHEIRTPLNAILGFSDILETSTSHLLGDEEKEFFNTIRDSGNRLMGTVHEILDISQIEAGTYDLKFEQLELLTLVKDLVNGIKPIADKKDLKMECDWEIDTAFIKADQNGMSQAISNIIDNAIKYTKQGKITISLKQKAKQYVLRIQDTGIGIAKEYLENLYDVFTQESEGYTKKFQGIGLGMAIAKRHLDMNKVGIDIDSTKDVGTTFTLTFNSVKEQIPEKQVEKEAKVKATAEPVEKPIILLVEDDPNSQRLIEFFLKGQFEIKFAVSVDEAKQQLKQNPVNLILLDLSLVGDEDGLDLVRWMRKSKMWQKTPVIATTAHAFTKDRDNCIAAGCDDYISKPINREKLVEIISRYI